MKSLKIKSLMMTVLDLFDMKRQSQYFDKLKRKHKIN